MKQIFFLLTFLLWPLAEAVASGFSETTLEQFEGTVKAFQEYYGLDELDALATSGIVVGPEIKRGVIDKLDITVLNRLLEKMNNEDPQFFQRNPGYSGLFIQKYNQFKDGMTEKERNYYVKALIARCRKISNKGSLFRIYIIVFLGGIDHPEMIKFLIECHDNPKLSYGAKVALERMKEKRVSMGNSEPPFTINKNGGMVANVPAARLGNWWFVVGAALALTGVGFAVLNGKRVGKRNGV